MKIQSPKHRDNWERILDNRTPEGRAYAIALRWHGPQVDKGGRPYIEHLTAVAIDGDDEDEVVVGLLHDILEDTDITVSFLLASGVTPEQVRLIQLLTRLPGETRMENIQRILTDVKAVKLKRRDVAHNLRLDRLPEITNHDLSLNLYYAKIKKLLDERLESEPA